MRFPWEYERDEAHRALGRDLARSILGAGDRIPFVAPAGTTLFPSASATMGGVPQPAGTTLCADPSEALVSGRRQVFLTASSPSEWWAPAESVAPVVSISHAARPDGGAGAFGAAMMQAAAKAAGRDQPIAPWAANPPPTWVPPPVHAKFSTVADWISEHRWWVVGGIIAAAAIGAAIYSAAHHHHHTDEGAI